ncbi:LysR family transcriptional regulator [Notoacmeibacter ruber]|uniref:LysR family transcriptional regulator n=1 Tax=Notoacmeibacter ruber TaxID=2670375 RepID=A0A3L7J9S7_9HYPH|nr:LysR family transcriptional regulator [Notoacmeibacter ruber]RLQ87250.1 LysR family transcriptional regulator [Notoacmeibacter ruber]
MTPTEELEIFSHVVSAGSLSAAGRELGLSPAVVSKRLRKLEDRLGTRLLQRTTRQIALTEAGQGFYERIVAVLAAVEEAEAFVSRRSAQAKGTLKISAPTSFGRMHIAPHLTSFMEAHTDLSINLVLSDEFVDIVAEGFDLAIRIAELPDSSLVARRLADVKRVLVASPAYISKHGQPQTFDDLDEHICLPPHNGEVWRLEGPDGEIRAFRPDGPLSTNSSEVLREAVVAGMGIALRSTWDVGPELAKGDLVHVLPEWGASKHIGLHAVYPSRRFLPIKVRLFIDYLADLYGPEPYWDNPGDALYTAAAE